MSQVESFTILQSDKGKTKISIFTFKYIQWISAPHKIKTALPLTKTLLVMTTVNQQFLPLWSVL